MKPESNLAGQTVRVLSLTQPYATLVALGAKRIETRSWKTPYRGPLAIHAAVGMPQHYRDLCYTQFFHAGIMQHVARIGRWEKGVALWQLLPRGVIVATCDLVDVESMDDLAFRLPGQPELSFGIYAPGRYAWKLENIQALATPLPHRGAQGLRTFQWPVNTPPPTGGCRGAMILPARKSLIISGRVPLCRPLLRRLKM